MHSDPGVARFERDERAVVQHIGGEILRGRARPGSGHALAVDEIVALAAADHFAGAAVSTEFWCNKSALRRNKSLVASSILLANCTLFFCSLSEIAKLI